MLLGAPIATVAGTAVLRTAVRKNVHFKPDATAAEVDECRRLAKYWLLWGRQVPHGDSDGRYQHLHVMGRALRQVATQLPIIPEEELDRLVLIRGASV